MSRVGNVHDAQDLTTQTFLAAQEAIANFRGRSKFTTWLMGVASRKTADHFRRQRATLPFSYLKPMNASTNFSQNPK
ncbi:MULTISPECIES: RNA polymerase sigma factor [Fischerella]|uniref:RNA polymerase sigma-70 region 2 domain-containing protein n=1 Tax=Fischerella muscicola CCMEE 5323 TaxID=2019572 RepID=A0A2N6K4Z2_FISMU|nr:sigma factor [Fischerella muscicola]PLZ91379.1 hypothetical protein CEN44_08765 [Fischerella muscicola CCMEE 5323]